MQDITADTNYQAMVALFSQGIDSATERESMLKDPLGALKSIGIAVDERHRDAVEQSLRAVLFAQTPSTGGPTMAKRAQSDFEKYVHVSLEFWGVVVRIDHEAINQLPRE